MAALFSLIAVAADYDQNKPFGFCTRSSRTDAACTYNITGGGCYTYPLPSDFAGKVIVLKSNGQDMRNSIQNAIKQNDVIIFDGSDGDFMVSSNIYVEGANKTLLGINNARLCTKWYVTNDIITALNKAGVPNMSTHDGGGMLPNGQFVREEAEYNTRKIIIELTGVVATCSRLLVPSIAGLTIALSWTAWTATSTSRRDQTLIPSVGVLSVIPTARICTRTPTSLAVVTGNQQVSSTPPMLSIGGDQAVFSVCLWLALARFTC